MYKRSMTMFKIIVKLKLPYFPDYKSHRNIRNSAKTVPING